MLLQKLTDKQKKLEMTDAVFAAKLGVSRQLWQFTRTERMPIGQKVIAGTCRAFPEMIPDVLIFLGKDVSIPTSAAS